MSDPYLQWITCQDGGILPYLVCPLAPKLFPSKRVTALRTPLVWKAGINCMDLLKRKPEGLYPNNLWIRKPLQISPCSGPATSHPSTLCCRMAKSCLSWGSCMELCIVWLFGGCLWWGMRSQAARGDPQQGVKQAHLIRHITGSPLLHFLSARWNNVLCSYRDGLVFQWQGFL